MKNIYKFFHNIIKIFLIYIWDDEISYAWNDSDVNFKKRLWSLFFWVFFLMRTNMTFHKAFGLNLRNLAAQDKGRENEQESSKGGLLLLNANIFIKELAKQEGIFHF